MPLPGQGVKAESQNRQNAKSHPVANTNNLEEELDHFQDMIEFVHIDLVS